MLAGGPRFPSSSAAPTPGAVRLARGGRPGGRRLLLPLVYRHRSPSTPSAAVPPFSDSASRPSSTSSRPRLTRYAPRREHLHARRRPSIPEPVRGTHSRRGAPCEKLDSPGASIQEPGRKLAPLPTHRSQHVSRGRCPFSDSGVVSGPQASAGYPIASGIPDRIKEALPGTAPFFSMQAARSGIGTARRLLPRPVGRPRWRPPSFRICLPRTPWRGVRQIPSAAPGDLCLDTAPQTTGEGRACARSAWRGALRLDQWKAPRQATRYRTIPPQRQAAAGSIRPWRGAPFTGSTNGAAPGILLTRPDTIPPLPAWRGAFHWFSAPAAKVAAGLHGNPIEGVKEA